MYTLLDEPNHVLRDEDQAYIPMEPDNRDYRDYLAWVAAGNTATPAAVPPAFVPEEISDRQFFQQLAVDGDITKAAALAAVKTGTLPAVIQGALDAMTDATQQFAAEMLLSGATTFKRHHPMAAVLAQILTKTDAQLDDIWIKATLL